jgi:hypothetical protein
MAICDTVYQIVFKFAVGQELIEAKPRKNYASPNALKGQRHLLLPKKRISNTEMPFTVLHFVAFLKICFNRFGDPDRIWIQ